jgi:hypothetical protein
MRGRAATILVALAAVLLLAASTGSALTLVIPREEPLQGKFSVTFSSPSPPTKRAPVAVRTAVRFRTEDGTQVPALQELKLRFDRHLKLNLREVPACSLAGIRPEPEKTCRDAVVARGTMKVDVRFTEGPTSLLSAKATVFKGDTSKGGPPLFLYTDFTAPIAATIATTIELQPAGGGAYGREAVASFPKIAGGQGSITHLELRFRHGIFAATCPRRGSLLAGFRARFAEGTVLSGAASRFCD